MGVHRQTYLPWESWQHPYILDEPPVWFHEVLRPDGTPYREAEVNLIRQLTGKQLHPGCGKILRHRMAAIA